MLLGGLWHGGNWTFVVWGGLHGLYLCINHGWHALQHRIGMPQIPGTRVVSIAVTFIAVVVAWVYFRSETLAAAHRMLLGMSGLHGFGDMSGGSPFEFLEYREQKRQLLWIPIGLIVVFICPNTQQIARSVLEKWQYKRLIGFVTGLGFTGLVMSFDKSSPFIYFQF